jgi:hypothetical protein
VVLVLVVVIVRVSLGSLGRVIVRVVMVSGCEMRMVPGLTIVALLVVLGGFAVMVRCVIVILRGFVMMFGG